jgi:hypothetical protein
MHWRAVAAARAGQYITHPPPSSSLHLLTVNGRVAVTTRAAGTTHWQGTLEVVAVGLGAVSIIKDAFTGVLCERKWRHQPGELVPGEVTVAQNGRRDMT